MPVFHEDWYSDNQVIILAEYYERVRNLEGMVVEIGCWEGKSTIGLCNAIYPEILHAVDHWEGMADQDPNHSTIEILKQRNVFKTFTDNIAECTKINILVHKMSWQTYFKTLKSTDRIKFCHLDGTHDYKSVHDNIVEILKYIVPNGIICGDDITTSTKDRKEFNGGVEQAVIDLLPGYGQIGNLWYWINKI